MSPSFFHFPRERQKFQEIEERDEKVRKKKKPKGIFCSIHTCTRFTCVKRIRKEGREKRPEERKENKWDKEGKKRGEGRKLTRERAREKLVAEQDFSKQQGKKIHERERESEPRGKCEVRGVRSKESYTLFHGGVAFRLPIGILRHIPSPL